MISEKYRITNIVVPKAENVILTEPQEVVIKFEDAFGMREFVKRFVKLIEEEE